MARTAFARVIAGIAVAALVALCQCSLLFDLSALDNAGLDAGADAGGVDERDGAADAGILDAAADAAGIDAAAESAVDAIGLEAAADAAGPDAVLDGRAEVGSPDASVDGGAEAGGADAAGDAGAEAGGADAPADSGGIALGLAAFYPFAEASGATSADASGNGLTATMQGATFTAGLQNNAATMNGSGQYVALPAGIMTGLTAFSISAWVNLTTALTHTHIFDFGTGTNAYMFLTPHSGSSMLQFAITTTGAGGEQVLNAPALSTGSWQHVCVTLVGTTCTLYVNGVQVAQNTAMTLNPTSLGATTQNWLGRSQFAADPYLNGKIDEFRIYGRALSPSEVQQLFLQRM